jgi:hypothetical protein
MNLWPNENLRAGINLPFVSPHCDSALSQRPHCTTVQIVQTYSVTSLSHPRVGRGRQTWLYSLGWKTLQFNPSHKQINQRPRTYDWEQTYAGVREQVQIYGGDSAVCLSGSECFHRFQRSTDGWTLQNYVTQQQVNYRIVINLLDTDADIFLAVFYHVTVILVFSRTCMIWEHVVA